MMKIFKTHRLLDFSNHQHRYGLSDERFKFGQKRPITFEDMMFSENNRQYVLYQLSR